MRTLTIESNGRIERTAVYINGEQVSGIHEFFVGIDEEGMFTAIVTYPDKQGNLLTKQIFSDDISQLPRRNPAYTDEDASNLQTLTIESDGTLDNTSVFINDEFAEGIVSLTIHLRIESQPTTRSLFSSLFQKKSNISDTIFMNEIVFRNSDGSESTETLF